ncbi:hypothetical protein [Streptomyces sp. NPDC002520]
MTNGTGTSYDRPPQASMTLRVYQVDRDGTVTADSGKTVVPPAKELQWSTAFPPCECPRHRVGQAARR